ncbi:MAG TPA: dockerin type I domain-containing protein [Isosphaeraceae bacterium]|nr:dockerin type I domain-containing protein [Isosphaeraceae bacterium]
MRRTIGRLASGRPDRRRARPGLEGLEGREVPSGPGALVPFATLSGAVATAGKPAVVLFEVQPGHVASDRAIPLLLGLDAVPAAGSAVTPKVDRILSLSGQATHAVATRNGPFLTGVSIPLSQPSVYAVRVVGTGQTTGAFTVEAFLPGDTNGDGRVDRVDLARVRSSYGSSLGSKRYVASADFDQDGRIGAHDLMLTRRNLGSTLSIVALTPTTATK